MRQVSHRFQPAKSVDSWLSKLIKFALSQQKIIMAFGKSIRFGKNWNKMLMEPKNIVSPFFVKPIKKLTNCLGCSVENADIVTNYKIQSFFSIGSCSDLIDSEMANTLELQQASHNMQQQQELPYVPMVFVKTGVIGGKITQKNAVHNQYDYCYRDFLKPHFLQNHNSVFYILFHSASIYNWLRTIPSKQTQLLNKYITTDRVEKGFNSLNNAAQIIASLEDYVSRWQVVKLTFCSTVYISKVRQFGSQSCAHLAKTQQNVIELHFETKTKTMSANKVKCKQCKRVVQIQGQLRTIGSQFLSKNSQFSLKVKQKNYQAFIFFTKNSIFVKSSSLAWFQINLQTAQSRLVGVSAINLKQVELTVYQACWELKNCLMPSQPIQMYTKNLGDKERKTKQVKQDKELLVQKQFEQTQVKIKADSNKLHQKEVKSKSNSELKNQKLNQKLSQLKFTPNKVILREQQYSKAYVEQVQKQYIKPKVKDEYQLDYDKGKLKKIKEKKHYIQPDYNQIYAILKTEEKSGKFQQSKKIRKERRNDRNDRKGEGIDRKDSHDDY